MDAVVKRAGTSPPVLYRRWSDRDDLARAAIVHAMKESRLDTPDTGSLRGDILTLIREINSSRVPLIIAMSTHLADCHQETGTSPGDLRAPLVTGRAEALDVLFGRAVDRGEIAPELLTERIKSLPFDLLRHDILTTFAPVPGHARRDRRHGLPPPGALSTPPVGRLSAEAGELLVICRWPPGQWSRWAPAGNGPATGITSSRPLERRSRHHLPGPAQRSASGRKTR